MKSQKLMRNSSTSTKALFVRPYILHLFVPRVQVAPHHCGHTRVTPEHFKPRISHLRFFGKRMRPAKLAAKSFTSSSSVSSAAQDSVGVSHEFLS